MVRIFGITNSLRVVAVIHDPYGYTDNPYENYTESVGCLTYIHCSRFVSYRDDVLMNQVLNENSLE